MNLEKLVAISGLSGVYKVVANKSNGLIIEDLETGKNKFVSSRKYQFTPLESISIYTDDDSRELSKVFDSMLEQYDDTPPVSPKSSKAVLEDYFADILPDYDRERVYPSDMKKVIKWFTYLKDRNLFEALEAEAETAATETTEAE